IQSDALCKIVHRLSVLFPPVMNDGPIDVIDALLAVALNRGGIIKQAPREISERKKTTSARVIGRCKSVVETDRLIEISDGLVVLTFPVIGRCPVIPGQGKFRIALDGLVQFGNRLIVFLPGLVILAAIVEDKCLFWIDANRRGGSGFLL